MTLTLDGSTAVDGYHRLVVAVLLQAVNDGQHGSLTKRAQVRQDIVIGGLDRWVDMVSTTHHGRDQLHSLFLDLLSA